MPSEWLTNHKMQHIFSEASHRPGWIVSCDLLEAVKVINRYNNFEKKAKMSEWLDVWDFLCDKFRKEKKKKSPTSSLLMICLHRLWSRFVFVNFSVFFKNVSVYCAHTMTPVSFSKFQKAPKRKRNNLHFMKNTLQDFVSTKENHKFEISRICLN